MSTSFNLDPWCDDDFRIISVDLPVMYEDEGQEEMGESVVHTESDRILYTGLLSHFASRPGFQILSNLNLHYHPNDPAAYVSPDEMVVQTDDSLIELRSYSLGKDGPAPLVAIEVLSKRSHQQQDQGKKVSIYASIGVREYILIDATGEFLNKRLLLKRLSRGRTWHDEQDEDGGVTSKLGFRIILEPDGQIRISDNVTGRKYLRPNETEANRVQLEQICAFEKQRAEAEKQRAEKEKQRAAMAEERAAVEAQARAVLEAEIERLKRLGR